MALESSIQNSVSMASRPFAFIPNGLTSNSLSIRFSCDGMLANMPLRSVPVSPDDLARSAR